MSGDPLKIAGGVVESLGSALRDGEHGLHTVPWLLKRALAEGSWREFVTQRGERVEHEHFAEFVTTPPLKGIGSSVDLVRRIVADDKEALDLLDQALQNPHGGDQSKNNNIQVAPQGTSAARALRKLRKDAPELHSDVLAGHLSAHAAMVKAGFRPKTFTVRGDRPDSIARALRKNLTREQLADLRKLLDE